MEKVVLIYLYCITSLSLFAQDIKSCEGTSFCIGFMNNEDPSEPETNTYQTLAITSRFNTHVEVSVPGSNWSISFLVQADSVKEILIPKLYVEQETFDVIEDKGVFVESKKPIMVSALNWDSFSFDATIIYPIIYLDDEYYTLAYRTDLYGINPPRSEYMIVATEDNTIIEIDYPNGGTYYKTLNRGQTYQNKLVDISGIKISGAASNGDCKPFALFCGAQAALIPNGCLTAWDHTFEQILPIKNLDTLHYIAPIKVTENYEYKIVAVEDNTVLNVNSGANVNLNSGDFVVYTGGLNDQVIKSNNPVMVGQYLGGAGCGYNDWGDPAFSIILPFKNRINYARFNNLETNNIDTTFLTVVIETPFINSVYLDNNLISPEEFITFQYDTTMSYAQISIPNLEHELKSDNLFQAYVYGLSDGNWESYFYNLGWYKEDDDIQIDSTFCFSGDTLMISNIGTPGNSWWSPYQNQIDTLSNLDSLILIAPFESNIYSFNNIDPLSGCIVNTNYNVEVYSQISFNINSVMDTLCASTTIDMSVASNVNPEQYSILWEPEFLFDNSNSFTTSYYPNESRWIYATLSSQYGNCVSIKDSLFIYVDTLNSLSSYDLNFTSQLLCNGDSADLNLTTYERIASDNFNGSINNLLWADTLGVMTTNTCNSFNTDALYFYGASSRKAETYPLNLSNGGKISFYAKSANSISACDVTEIGDDLFLQYSIDNGLTWDTISVLYEYMYHSVLSVEVVIPIAAQSANTKLRFIQTNFDGLNLDVWMVDNFKVELLSNTWNVNWLPSTNISNVNSYSPTIYPSVNTWFTYTIENGSCDIVDSVYIEADSFQASIVMDSVNCINGMTNLEVELSNANTYEFYWGSNFFSSIEYCNSTNNTLAVDTNVFEQIFNLTVISESGCESYDTITVPPSWKSLSNFSTDVSVCLGDTNYILYQAMEMITDDFNDSTYNDSIWYNIQGGHLSQQYGSIHSTALVFDSAAVRHAETNNFNTLAGGTIRYSVSYGSSVYGVNSLTNYSFASDYVRLLASNDNGVTWTQIHMTGTNNTGFTSCIVDIPSQFQTSATKFKWKQNSGAILQDYNIFILENVAISSPVEHYTYNWELPLGNQVGSGKNLSIDLDSSAYVYVVLNDTINECTALDSVFIQVGDVFNIQLNDISNCVYLDSFYISAGLPVGSDYSFQWVNDYFSSTDSIFGILVTDQLEEITVTIESSEGCTLYDTMTIYTPFNYGGVVILGDTTVCYGDEVNLKAMVAHKYMMIDFTGTEPYATYDSQESTAVTGGYDCDAAPPGLTGVVKKMVTSSGERKFTMDMWAGWGNVNALEYYFAYGNNLLCDPSEIGEEVYFQYSQDYGTTWNNIDTLVISEHLYLSKVFTKLPVGVNPGNSILRWIQPNYTPVYKDDIWYIANIQYLFIDETPVTYSWEVDNTPAFTDTNFVSSVVTTQSMYEITISDSTGCILEDSVLVSSINLTVDAGSDTTLCPANGYFLNGTTSASGNYSILWSNYLDNSISNKWILNPFIQIDQSYDFILGINKDGCLQHDTVQIISNPYNPLDFQNDTLVCVYDSIHIDLSNATSIAWSPTQGILDMNTNNPTIVIDSIELYNISYVLNECFYIDSINFFINEIPTVLLPSDFETCIFDLQEIEGFVTGNNVTYLWSNGISDSSNFISSGEYWLQVSNYCGTDIDTIIATGIPTPNVELPNDTSYCILPPYEITPMLNDLNSNIMWSTGESTSTIIVNSPGVYWIEINSVCGIDSDTIEIIELLPPDITTTLNELTISSNENNSTYYQWIDCVNNEIIIGESNQDFTPNLDGEYAVIINYEGNCIDTSNCVLFTLLDVGINNDDFKINLYPNPTTGFFRIEYTLISIKQLQIIDMQGNIVYSDRNIFNNQEINISDLSSGNYFIVLIDDNSSIHKVILTKD